MIKVAGLTSFQAFIFFSVKFFAEKVLLASPLRRHNTLSTIWFSKQVRDPKQDLAREREKKKIS